MIVKHADHLLKFLPTELSKVRHSADVADNARGVLAGLAVGNILGLPWEGMTAEEIQRMGGLIEPDPEEAGRNMDDDLALAVELGEALLEQETFLFRGVVGNFARRLINWRRTNGRGIGHMTAQVIDEWRRGSDFPAPAREVWLKMNRMAPNGGVMRCAPVALRYVYDPAQLISVSSRTCAVTHYSLWCQWSCILINAVIAALLQGGVFTTETVGKMVYAAELDMGMSFYEQAVKDDIPSSVFEAFALHLDPDLQLFEFNQHLWGHTLIALQMGLWAAVTPLYFEAALREVIRVGGDTDTNSAVVGAVLGARYGFDAIPGWWLTAVPDLDRVCALASQLNERAHRRSI